MATRGLDGAHLQRKRPLAALLGRLGLDVELALGRRGEVDHRLGRRDVRRTCCAVEGKLAQGHRRLREVEIERVWNESEWIM